MARQIHDIEAFVASPSDVAAERDAVREVVQEINHSLKRHYGIQISLVGWETDTYPAVGADAQDVINSQIPDDFDVFLGIFWHRIGTQTGRALSGTVEEFERALNRWKTDKASVEISVYFKTAPLPYSDVDPTQFQDLKEFRTRVRGEGAYTFDFLTVEDFKTLLRTHLQEIALKLKKRRDERHPQSITQEIATSAAIAEADDLGLLEFQEIFTQSMGRGTQILEQLSFSFVQLGKRAELEANNIVAANTLGDTPDAMKSIAAISVAMIEFAEFVEGQSTELDRILSKAMDGLEGAIRIAPDFPGDMQSLSILVPATNDMIMTVDKLNLEAIAPLSLIINGIPRINAPARKAKRQVQASLVTFSNLLVKFRQRLITARDLTIETLSTNRSQ